MARRVASRRSAGEAGRKGSGETTKGASEASESAGPEGRASAVTGRHVRAPWQKMTRACRHLSEVHASLASRKPARRTQLYSSESQDTQLGARLMARSSLVTNATCNEINLANGRDRRRKAEKCERRKG